MSGVLCLIPVDCKLKGVVLGLHLAVKLYGSAVVTVHLIPYPLKSLECKGLDC